MALMPVQMADKEDPMKHLTALALMLTLGVASLYAHERPVKMRFSGSMVPTSIVMQPDTITDDELLTGDGALGPFTFRKLRTDALAPQPSDACSGASQLNIPVVAGGGVFRFEDGSLLTVAITEGALCIDLTVSLGRLTEMYQITGGTGRFKGASGTLTSTATLSPVLISASGQVTMLASTGRFDGTLDAQGLRNEK
jgi:hypothetical protein